MRALRDAIGGAGRSAADAAIAARLEALVARIAPACIACYWPIGGEPDLRASVARWRAAGIDTALPRVAGEGAALVFDRWSPGDALVAGPYGTSHAARPDPVRPGLLVIPCLGFAPGGHRLGYGGGYYDRTLAACAPRTVGVAYDLLEVTGFEAQPHDRPLEFIVTESRVLPGSGYASSGCVAQSTSP